ncbi:retrovirus-related Pol polyprotein from transposon 297 [Trichonephila clavipes]|nr:retrovirus-related Pol polyprotein from transposon 297 [Trichonephila clavipes]
MRPIETVFQYLVAVRELANRGQGFLDETSIMEYCINGIPDSSSNKLILYGCTTIQEFKEKLGIYDKIFQNKSRNRSYDMSRNPNFSSQRRDYGNDKPIYHYPRPLPFTERDIVGKQIDEWTQNGIIEQCSSAYASQVLVVRKKDGSPRVCIDFRKLNRVLVKDHYPLPLIEDILDKLQNTRVFGTIDLLFRDLVVQGIVLPYMDDIVILAKNESVAIDRLKKVLKVSRDYGLEINFDKGQFLHRKIEFFGHIIENNKLFPSPSKTKSVVHYLGPKTTKEVQRFLRLTGYFRKFIPSYSVIAKSLSDLLRKDTPFNFDVKQKASFDELKCLLCQKPVLGESATADEGVAKIFPEELAKIIEDGEYSADQVFDADETGLYWKKLPNHAHITKDEKTANLTVDRVVGVEGDKVEEEKSTPLTGKLIQEGLQLCSKLENHFLINGPNSKRASKLQRRATQNENEVCENPWRLTQISIAETVSSDDEGDLEPLRKRCKQLSDSDND